MKRQNFEIFRNGSGQSWEAWEEAGGDDLSHGAGQENDLVTGLH